MVNAHRSLKYPYQIRVNESNGGLRILTGSSGIAVSAHAQYRFGHKSLTNAQRLPKYPLRKYWICIPVHYGTGRPN